MATESNKPKLTIIQDGKVYDLYNLPKEGFFIEGDLILRNKNLTELPDLSKVVIFGKFDCSYNKLTSLKGCPEFGVGGGFDCSHNKLTTLKGCFNKCYHDFDCSHNELTSLDGAPREVFGKFNCSNNQLTTLKGAPIRCGFGYPKDYFKTCNVFNFASNKVMSLKNLPKIPYGSCWNCEDNPIQIEDSVQDDILNNIRFFIGISKEIKSQLLLKKRQQLVKKTREAKTK